MISESALVGGGIPVAVRLIRAEAFSANGSTNCIHSGQSDQAHFSVPGHWLGLRDRFQGDVFREGSPPETKPGEQVGDGDAESAS